MKKKTIIIALSGVLALGAIIALRFEPTALGFFASQIEKHEIGTRIELVSKGVETHYPDTDDVRFPTVLMFHGCGGAKMPFLRDWAKRINDAGYAALIVDSLRPRGIDREQALKDVCGGKILIGQERAGDVAAAIEIAKQDPRLDTDHLVLAGWSHGAWTIMDYMAMDMRRARPAGLKGTLPASPKISGLVLFYPYCSPGAWSRFRKWDQNPPTVSFMASDDSIVDPAACQTIFDRHNKKTEIIDYVIYQGAEHGFDDAYMGPEWNHWHNPEYLSDAATRMTSFLDALPR